MGRDHIAPLASFQIDFELLGAIAILVVNDPELVAFLQWALPRMGLRWLGFKNFRGTLRKRIARRLAELGLPGLAAYRSRLEEDESEWTVLDGLCRITISRLYRDRAVIDDLRDEILPRAAERTQHVRIWSAGCASGEEPYTLAILWALVVGPKHPGVELSILASDVDPALIERARCGAYESGSLRDLPDSLRDAGLRREGDLFVVREELRSAITFEVRDIRSEMPEGPFDVLLCRNVAFTYFDEPTQREVGIRLIERLADDGVLVIGGKESIPADLPLVEIARAIYARA